MPQINWLQGKIADLWENNGKYPGLPIVLKYLQVFSAIPIFKEQQFHGGEQQFKEAFFNWVNYKSFSPVLEKIDPQELEYAYKIWHIENSRKNALIESIMTRFNYDLKKQNSILIELLKESIGRC